MALNIKNAEVEELAREVAEMTGESKTTAIGRALAERRERLRASAEGRRRSSFRRHLEHDVWPKLPKKVAGRRISRREEDAILGYGPEGA